MENTTASFPGYLNWLILKQYMMKDTWFEIEMLVHMIIPSIIPKLGIIIWHNTCYNHLKYYVLSFFFILGQSGRALALHEANLGLIPCTPYGLPSWLGVIPECRTREKVWALLGVAQKQNQKTLSFLFPLAQAGSGPWLGRVRDMAPPKRN